MSTHRIHLRRPWQCEATTRSIRWTRRFHRPSGLGPSQQVWLVCEGFRYGPLEVLLNGQLLGTFATGVARAQFEISGRLAMQNEVLLEGAVRSGPAALASDHPPGEVCLEIRECAVQ